MVRFLHCCSRIDGHRWMFVFVHWIFFGVRACAQAFQVTSCVNQGFFRIIKTQGGGDPSPKTPSPPPQTKVTIVGKNEIYNRENLVRPFLVHQVLGPKPPPPLPPPAQKKPWCEPYPDASML